ncbi:hypothetical protein, partial [Bacillus altitudinis]|uniref:hypothetical protein n=1 Tax=Bacillus altitudinis TaxID=293387 RepID=UPI001C92BBEC
WDYRKGMSLLIMSIVEKKEEKEMVEGNGEMMVETWEEELGEMEKLKVWEKMVGLWGRVWLEEGDEEEVKMW